MRPSRGIRVGSAGKRGRGVFAVKHFQSDDLIERAPLVVINARDVEVMEETGVSGYWYDYGGGKRAIGLGYTSLYNHSHRPNAVYTVRDEPDVIVIVALREIKPGTEIKVNYNGDPKDKAKLYFEDTASEDTGCHYEDAGGWGDEGWCWCGKNEKFRTDIPSLVTCKGCIEAMVDEKERLADWSPNLKPRSITKNGVMIALDWVIRELEGHDSMNGAAMTVDVRKALRRIPAKVFPGYKNGKAK